jgi:hypothetical protein
MVGYDYSTKKHRVEIKLIDADMHSIESKMGIFEWARMLPHQTDYDVLALSFVSNAMVQDIDGTWYPVIYVTKETRHTTSHQVFRIQTAEEPVPESDSVRTVRRLVFDKKFTDRTLSDEMYIFRQLFHNPLGEN